MSALPQSITGMVMRGQGRARELGAPTLNIPLVDSSLSGIFAGRVISGEARHIAVVFANPNRGVIEAHLLDFPEDFGDVQGKEITIELLAKLRESEMFSDDEALKAAIAEDIANAREFLQTLQ